MVGGQTSIGEVGDELAAILGINLRPSSPPVHTRTALDPPAARPVPGHVTDAATALPERVGEGVPTRGLAYDPQGNPLFGPLVRTREKLTCVVYGVSWGCIV